ncbi:hypothetical protein FOA52_002524 [Chlamydomonas sp. UWO 241]|nr:hypothetical protein FOA52_002524 [Chlamydomonas sp. UWO 241]
MLRLATCLYRAAGVASAGGASTSYAHLAASVTAAVSQSAPAHAAPALGCTSTRHLWTSLLHGPTAGVLGGALGGSLRPSCGVLCSQLRPPALLRGVFGVAPKKVNAQIHNHEKYKRVHPQPTYDWMVGRFIRDRNGAIWHQQANSSHRRHSKSSGQQGRLARLKPLATAYASKLRKLGFKRKYWLDPDARMVPGFHKGPLTPLARHSSDPDLRDKIGDPALRPH